MDETFPVCSVRDFNINTAGFVIAGMFIVTWLAALLIWRSGRSEEKWSARLEPAATDDMACETR